MRGRKPKAEAVKAQTAPVRSKRTPPATAVEPKVAVAGVKPPASVKGEALKLWNGLAPKLVQAKLLTDLDVPAFARYCRLAARWEAAEKALDQEGLTYESESQHGKLKRAHPAAMLSMRYARELMALETQFGLLPAERQRLMAQRAQTGITGDLFGAPTPAPKPAGEIEPPPARPTGSPVGLLN